MVYEKIIDLIGNTPIVKIENNIYLKLEKFNMSGSIKDRAAKDIIKNAITNKKINKETTVIEATSGNLGISLSAICNFYKLKCIIVMPKSASKERMKLIKKYNAKLVLVNKGMNKATNVAKKIANRIKNYYIVNQFDNEYNISSNYTTGEEIIKDVPDVDCIICGIGSAGSISGIAKYLKMQNKKVKIIGVEPKESPLISKGYHNKHHIQGIGADFIPANYDERIIDEIITVSTKEAYLFQKKLLDEQSILCGISAGAVLNACYKVKDKFKKIVAIMADGGERYL